MEQYPIPNLVKFESISENTPCAFEYLLLERRNERKRSFRKLIVSIPLLYDFPENVEENF